MGKINKNIENNSIVLNIIKTIESENLKFIANNSFYNETNINSKRFAKILRSEISPTLDELKAICLFFKVDIKDYIN